MLVDRFKDVETPGQGLGIIAGAIQKHKLSGDEVDELIDHIGEYSPQISGYMLARDFVPGLAELEHEDVRIADRWGDILATEFRRNIVSGEKDIMDSLAELGGSRLQAEEWQQEMAQGDFATRREATIEIFKAFSKLDDKQKETLIGTKLFGDIFGDQQERLTAVIEKTAEGYDELGGDVEKFARRHEGALNEVIKKTRVFRSELDEMTGGALGPAGELFGAALPSVSTIAGSYLGNKIANRGLKQTVKDIGGTAGRAASKIGSFAGRFGILAKNIGTKVLPTLGRFATGLGRFVTGPVGATIITVGTLAYEIYKHWDTISEKTGLFVNEMGDFFGGMRDGIIDDVNMIVDAVNGMIQGINGIEISVPDWVPKIGGVSWSPDIGYISHIGSKGLHIPQVPGLAEGGEIIRSGLTLVGERGPELLHLPAGAQVQPLPAAGTPDLSLGNRAVQPLPAGASGDINVYIDARGASPGVGQEIRRVMRSEFNQLFDVRFESRFKAMSLKRPLITER